MFKKLEKWLNDYERNMLEELLSLKKDVEYAKPIIREQLQGGGKVSDNKELREIFKGYESWDLPKRYEVRRNEDRYYVYNGNTNKCEWKEGTNNYIDAIVTIDGKEYRHTVLSKTCHYSIRDMKYDALAQYIASKGHNPNDIDFIEGRSEEWIVRYCAKEKEAKRKYIEAKVKAICGEVLEEVDGAEINDLYVRGNNNRTAHIWAVLAGGHSEDVIVNVKHGQRLHIRILVKEVK